MKYSRYDNGASRLHKNGPLQPPAPDPWWDRPKRFFGLTALDWLVAGGFLIGLAITINLLAWIGDKP